MRRVVLVALLASVIPLCAYAADVPVTESDLKFDHESVTLNAGDALELTNRDEVTHNIQVVDDNAAIFLTKALQRSGSHIKIDFPHPGIYKVRCSIYPQTKMSVTGAVDN